MKRNRMIALACTTAIIATIGITSVFAATDDNESTQTEPTRPGMQRSFQMQRPELTEAGIQGKAKIRQRNMPELTEEQKAQMEEKRVAMEEKIKEQQSKWEALTEEQKAEIFALKDQACEVQTKILDKYEEFGILDSETKAEMKENMSKRNAEMKENGRLPMMRMQGGRQGGMRGEKAGDGMRVRLPFQEDAANTIE